jgi:hypothetical protein
MSIALWQLPPEIFFFNGHIALVIILSVYYTFAVF